jgi:ATP-dependent protease ClpP protease subunit
MTLSEYQTAHRDKRVIHLNGNIDDEFITNFKKQIDVFTRPPGRESIIVCLASRGGNIMQGLALHSELTALAHGDRLWITCQSEVGAAAILVMLAVPRERRVAFPHTSFLLSKCNMNFKLDLSGPAKLHRIRLKEYENEIVELERREETFVEMLADGTGMSIEKTREMVCSPTYLSLNEAIDLGLISEVLK